MFAEVWQQVVRGRYASQPAILHGYARFAVRDETYPGIVAQSDAQVPGLVYLGIDAADLAQLDQFEGDDYRRIETVVTAADGRIHPVQTYLYLNQAGLSDQPWRPERFALEQFLATYCRDKLGG